MVSFKGFLVVSSLIVPILLSVTEFFSDVSLLSAPCGAAVIVVAFVWVVVIVSIGLVCFIVGCDFARFVMFGLSSVAVVRC